MGCCSSSSCSCTVERAAACPTCSAAASGQRPRARRSSNATSTASRWLPRSSLPSPLSASHCCCRRTRLLVNRRAVVAGIVVVLAFVGGCTDSKKPAPASSSASTKSDAPVKGGTLRLGIERPKSLDPAAVSPGSQSELLVADPLFDGLTHLDDQGATAGPAIASAWTPSPDQKSWQVALRPDARVSNGRAIGAA